MEPEDLMAELYTNGPIEVAFEVYEVIIENSGCVSGNHVSGTSERMHLR